MSALIGSTGFVGRHLQKHLGFTHKFNRSNIAEIQGLDTNLLICAGLPAEKWIANNNPESDWYNMASLAQNLSNVKAEKAILISTIDVYQPPLNVTESQPPTLIGSGAYGQNRAWFELFFRNQFPNASIIRLPGLFGEGLKKNLVFDLINNNLEILANINPESEFQYFDLSRIWEVIEVSLEFEINLLNVTSEPIKAGEIADIAEFRLNGNQPPIKYDVQSIHYSKFNGTKGYLFTKETVLAEIRDFLVKWDKD